MRITGIEALTFGVEDVAESVRFCTDFGFAAATSPDGHPRMVTRDKSWVEIRHLGDPGLPPTDIQGSTLRLLTWGVEDAAALDEIAAELSKDRNVHVGNGVVQSRDDCGQAIAFEVTQKHLTEPAAPASNAPGVQQRPVNSRVPWTNAVQPTTVAHCVFDCADETKARAFYVERLGFIVSDSFRGAGAFLRTAISREHHSIFTVQRTPAGLNHAAFYVTDMHEIMIGGMRMMEKGWTSQWGPGRHKLGSNCFWYFKSPLGGNFEYTCDGDYIDENWVPMELELSRENSAMWYVTGLTRSISA